MGVRGILCYLYGLQQIFCEQLYPISSVYNPEYEMDCPDAISNFTLHSWKIPMGTPYRAIQTAPYPDIAIRTSSIPYAGLGTFAQVFMKADTWLGEYEGIVVPRTRLKDDTDDTYMWKVLQNGFVKFYCDAVDLDQSNWLRFVNGARTPQEQNVMGHQCFDKIFYRVTKDVSPGSELLVYYGKDYTANLGIDTSVFSHYD